MIDPDQALAILEERLARKAIQGSEDVDIAQACGRVLAASLRAPLDQPPTDMSAMDGYALASADTAAAPCWLDVAGESAAGGDAPPLKRGSAVRIYTGAPMPVGSDSVLIEEQAPRDKTNTRIRVTKPVAPGSFVRRKGLDFPRGSTHFAPGTILASSDIALAAAMNYARLAVRRKVRVALLSLGDELVAVGGGISRPSQIIASSLPALKAMLSCEAVEIHDLGIAADDAPRVRAILQKASMDSDLIVTTGGASIGRYDVMRQILTRCDEVLFDKVAIRPGKPTILAMLGGTPILALPGNPVSSLVCGYVFLAAALRALLAIVPRRPKAKMRARLAKPLPKGSARHQFLRARIEKGRDGTLAVEPFVNQDSAMISLLARSDVLIRRAAHARAARKGSYVDIIPLVSSVWDALAEGFV